MIRKYSLLALGAALGLWAGLALAQEKEETSFDPDVATIVQARGADQSVDYASLRRYGPWDDRNYDLTARDLALLPANDEYRHDVPAFFKVLKRKEFIAEGTPLDDIYPRETNKEFELRFGGLLQDGILHRHGLGIYSHPDPDNPPPPRVWATDPIPHAVPLEGEGPMALGDEETSIKYNPVDPMKVVAGSNAPSGGQVQNYSTDGGVTWLAGGTLPGTCCDPAMEWSADGTVVYAATLIGSSSFRAGLFRSTNGGQTYGAGISVSTGSSDKEYIHVDKSPTSPFKENVYLTWHQGNVMYFARSTDKGVTWSTPLTFSSDARGIGSDITTDAAGNIYYVWPSSQTATPNVYVKKSTDGGLTFGPQIVVQPLYDVYDFPLPSMESRNAFIYMSVDADTRTSGTHAGRIYATYTALHPSSPAGGTNTAQNHAWIRVAYSDDQGATWQLATTPHSEADIATVDRYHPWLEVDGNGVVHIGFYDTRNWPDRSGVDFYYAYSADGGATWLDETRVSQIRSVNITNGQEWGDYNGLAASPTTVAMSWSDNRIPSGTTPVQHSYVGRVTNVTSGPTYTMSAGTTPATVCAGSPVPDRSVSVQGFSGFVSPITLSFPGLNAAVFPTAVAAPNPVAAASPAATSTVSLTTAFGAPSGTYPVVVQGTNGGATPIVRSAGFNVNVVAAEPTAPSPSTPVDNANGVGLKPTLTWAATPGAVSYVVEISTTPTFDVILESGTVSGTSYTTVATLAPTTNYYWRVRAGNPCGDSRYSVVRHFITGFEVCFTGNVAIPDNNTTGVSTDLAVAAPGVITDLNVSVKINHTWPGDLDLQLTHLGSSTAVTIGTRLGGTGCQIDNVDVTLDDEAAGTITCSTSVPGIGGTVRPSNPLTAFDGKQLNSGWRLTVIDRANLDSGALTEFCLKPTVFSDVIFANGFDP